MVFCLLLAIKGIFKGFFKGRPQTKPVSGYHGHKVNGFHLLAIRKYLDKTARWWMSAPLTYLRFYGPPVNRRPFLFLPAGTWPLLDSGKSSESWTEQTMEKWIVAQSILWQNSSRMSFPQTEVSRGNDMAALLERYTTGKCPQVCIISLKDC